MSVGLQQSSTESQRTTVDDAPLALPAAVALARGIRLHGQTIWNLDSHNKETAVRGTLNRMAVASRHELWGSTLDPGPLVVSLA